MHSKLFYFGTKTEVMLGDSVIWKRLIRRDLKGTVIYIPGISPKHSDFEYDGIRQWGIDLENGNVLLTLYNPKECQPKRDIRFINRGEAKSFPIDEKLS